MCFEIAALIRNSKVELKLKGTPVTLNITTAGGVQRKEYSKKYNVPLIDKKGHRQMVTAYGIDKVMNDISSINTEELRCLFSNNEVENLQQHQCGPIDLLVGFDYAVWHPVKVEVQEHLVVLSNIFGTCITGSQSPWQLTK